MNITIHKFPLQLTDSQVLAVPGHIKCLSVQEQNGQLMLWAVVDKSDPDIYKVGIEIVGTGREIDFRPDLYRYLSTAQMNGYVWHIWVDE